MGLTYVDAGMLFRLGAYLILGKKIATLMELIPLYRARQIEYSWRDGRALLIFNGDKVDDVLRTSEVALATAKICELPENFLNLINFVEEVLRGVSGGVVDGRSAGSLLLADADIRVYLDAPIATRATRRYRELLKRGSSESYEVVYAAMLERDRLDRIRVTDPLTIAKDAIYINTENLTPQVIASQIVAMCQRIKGLL